MNILGPETVTFGVDDMAVAKKFWSDFGLKQIEDGADRLLFETAEKTSIEVRPIDAPDLPAAPVEGNTAREITWGVETKADLDAAAARLEKVTSITREEGVVRAVDPNGYAIALRVSQRVPVEAEPFEYNRPAAHERINRRAPLYASATPQTMAHVVVLSPKLQEAFEFYRDGLDFRHTDTYPERGIFMRANGSSEHHNLFLLNNGQLGFHHVAFEVRNIHEVFGGGLNMTENGWKTHLGPGRHPISSAYFWYFHNPCGGAAEYDSDTDRVDDNWVPEDWEPGPEAFAEWAFPEGTGRFKGNQGAVKR